MQHSDTETIALRFLQAWNAGETSVVPELAAPDLTVHYSHFPEPIQGAEAFQGMLEQVFVSFPDMRIRADEVLVDGERAMVRWTYTATHQQGEVFGVQPTGKPVRVSGITVYRIVGGRVVSEEGVADSLSLMLQLGAI